MSSYTLHDTFNDRELSRHRSLRTAVQAQVKFDRAVRRANGDSSYVPTAILDSDGNNVMAADHPLQNEYYAEQHRATYGNI